MCGITAFTGQISALPFLMQGLEKLEYRGYDSAGVTLVSQDCLRTYKVKGRLKDLEDILNVEEHSQVTGIGHTRWATHGIPSELNSHPHMNENQTISIVHNGIIENYQEIKDELIKKGYTFISQTDSEVIVHLIDFYNQGDIFEAVKKTLKRLQGSYALCIVSSFYPNQVIVAKKESPMILGQYQDGTFCASDIPAVLEYTRDVIVLDDGQMAILTPDKIQVYDCDGQSIDVGITHIPYDLQAAQKGGYETFMLKEIHEQPQVIFETLRSYFHGNDIQIEALNQLDWNWKSFQKVYFIACGTAYHACLYAQYLFEKWVHIPAICMPASEMRYREPRIDKKTLCIFVSQSGETADTLAALKLIKEKKGKSLSVTNVLGSSLDRMSDCTLYTCAGPEIAVASTKAYTTQLVLLGVMMLALSQKMAVLPNDANDFLEELERLPSYIEKTLTQEQKIASYAQLFKNQKDAYFIGRQLDYVSVVEGALKLKEISYIHADAYYAGELKHGPIALIEENSLVVAVACQENIISKTLSNIQETVTRGAEVLFITTENQKGDGLKHSIHIPSIHPLLTPILVAIVLQLLAYYVALSMDCDVDKPRNLAKSVTVE